MTWIKTHIFDIIAVLILLIFASAWIAVLAQVWAYPAVDPATGVAPAVAPRLALSSALVLAAGVLATTIGTQTAAALGFAVAEVKAAKGAALYGSGRRAEAADLDIHRHRGLSAGRARGVPHLVGQRDRPPPRWSSRTRCRCSAG